MPVFFRFFRESVCRKWQITQYKIVGPDGGNQELGTGNWERPRTRTMDEDDWEIRRRIGRQRRTSDGDSGILNRGTRNGEG